MKLSENAEHVLTERYYLKNDKGEVTEDWKSLCKRVCNAAAQAEEKLDGNIEKWSNEFFDMMYNLDFLPNSPTMFNAGKEKGLLSACFILDIEDNMQSILKTLSDAAMLFKYGGGVGLSFNSLRPEGEAIKTTGGTSSGPVSFMRMFDTMTEVVKQGGKRRGALLGLLNIDHKDILKFITCKEKEGELSNFNISVGITDEFMYKVKSKDPKALELWNKIIEGAWNNGEPGVSFLDTINAANPVPHMGRIKSSNPCLSGDTLISTEEGLRRIDSLIDKKPYLLIDSRFDYIQLSRAYKVFKTGRKRIWSLELDNGMSIKATLNHKFLTSDGWKEFKDLQISDDICIQTLEGFNSPNKYLEKEKGIIIGSIVGDGWVGKKSGIVLSFNEDIINKLFGIYVDIFRDHPYKITFKQGNNKGFKFGNIKLYNLCHNYGLYDKNSKHNLDKIVLQSKDFIVGYLRVYLLQMVVYLENQLILE